MSYQHANIVPLRLWPARDGRHTVEGVAKLRDEDYLFRERLGHVLVAMRERLGWTREDAADELGIPLSTLGKWERGDNAPKGYDLGRLYRGYEKHGVAKWEWFLEPPEVVRVDPVQSHLDSLERAGAISADEREARVQARRQQAVEKRRASRDTPGKRTRPRSPRPGRDQ